MIFENIRPLKKPVPARGYQTLWQVARLWLLDRAEEQYDAGEMLGAAILFHAEMYLKDRRADQLAQPPDQYAIAIYDVEPSA